MILEVRGQKVKVTMDIYGNKLVNNKLGRHFNHGERMNPIDFGCQRSKVKVTIDIYGNKLVNTIAT